MEAIKFPQQTHTLAENQPEYNPLPVHIDQENEAIPMTCCFELTADEISEITRSKKLWYTQLTFGNPFQPVLMTTRNPFQTAEIQGAEPGDNVLHGEIPPTPQDQCCNFPKVVGAISGELVTAVHEAIGAASMCWEFPEKAGMFQSERASQIARELLKVIASNTTPKS